MENMKAEYQAAAKWWADKLRGPVRFDNGADDSANQLASTLAVLANAESPSAADKIDAFCAVLERRLSEGAFDRVRVDYHPDPVLVEAAREAGIQVNGMTTFPWKTNMRICEGNVEVAEGYGKPYVRIFPV